MTSFVVFFAVVALLYAAFYVFVGDMRGLNAG